MAGDKEIALTFIDNSIPQNIKNQLDKGLKGNFDFEKSKYVKKEINKITVDTLVAFNYDL